MLKDVAIGASQTLYIRLDQDVDAHFEGLKDKVSGCRRAYNQVLWNA